MSNQNKTDLDLSYKQKMEQKLIKVFKKTEKSVAGFFIKNYRFTYLIIFFIVSLGFFSLFTLPREAEPEVRVPFAVVNTIYPGATPTDIEELITDKIEEKIKNLENLKEFNSTSGQGYSSIFVEYNAEADLQESFRKLREAVDESESELPSEAETPVVKEINFNDMPIVTYSLVGDYDILDLKKFADKLQEKFENIKDVSEAPIIGGLEREFQVIANQAKLANFEISLGQIVSAIQTSNFSMPAGNIEVDGFQYGIRVKGKFEEAKQLNDIVIATYNNSPVFLRDIALSQDAYKEKETESRIGFKKQNSKETISLQISKKTGGNILNIVKDSQRAIDNLYQSGEFPENLIIQKTNDNSVFIKEDLKTLGSSGLQTVVLITIILMLILSLRGALITAMAVPIAFLMAFIFLNIQGMTLNSMVLFSLVLSLGLMVDNSIVIIEGINEYVSEYGKSIYEAAILSVWNFKWAIIAGTMTTVSAFVPMLLVSGILGEYMGILPKTISVTLISSLFVAIIVIPTLATRFIKKSKVGHRSHRDKKRHIYLDKNMAKIKNKYIEILKNILPNKKKRIMLLAASWILFILAIATPLVGIMKIEMFPNIDLDYFVVNIESPVGSTLEKTRLVSQEVEKIIIDIPELDNYVINLGSSTSLGFGGGDSTAEHLASVTVNLTDKDKRKRKSYEIAASLREKLSSIQGAEVLVEELEAGPPSGAPIEIRIFGEKTKDISTLAEKINNFLKKTPGVINVKDSAENAAGEFIFTIDKQKADYYGLNVATISSTLRNAVYGREASEVNINGEDIDITVKYDKNFFNNINDLKNILLPANTGETIPLKEVANVNLEPSLLSIKHRNAKKIIAVTADLESDIDLNEILLKIENYQKTLYFPPGSSIEIGGEEEDIQKSFQELFYSMIIAVLLIAMILVLQFNSFKQPFIIIFSLPLAVVGVIIGLNILRQPFGFPVFIGMVSLSGIVVNDAIVLIDRINKNIANGMEFFSAIIDGGLARMQPIFLTSLTTIAGIFPLIYANELWRGLSLTVIFGLIFSTVLTLVIIPAYYASLCRKEKCG